MRANPLRRHDLNQHLPNSYTNAASFLFRRRLLLIHPALALAPASPVSLLYCCLRRERIALRRLLSMKCWIRFTRDYDLIFADTHCYTFLRPSQQRQEEEKDETNSKFIHSTRHYFMHVGTGKLLCLW